LTPTPPARPHARAQCPPPQRLGQSQLLEAVPSRGWEHFETLEVHTHATWSPRPRRPAVHRGAHWSVGVRLPGRAGRGYAAIRAGLIGRGRPYRETWPLPLPACSSIKTPVGLPVRTSAPSPPLLLSAPTSLLTHSLPRQCRRSCTSSSVHKSSHHHLLPRIDLRLTGARAPAVVAAGCRRPPPPAAPRPPPSTQIGP
jgi:hypothetical protein